MIYSRAMIPAMILSASLLTPACKDKQAAQENAPETVFQSAATSHVSEKTFEPLLKVKKRAVKSASANIALAKMGLDEAANGPFSWDKKKGDKGDYTFTNLSATDADDKTVKIATLKLAGVRMEGEDPTFDRMDINGLSVIEGDKNVAIAKVSLARPSPALGASIMAVVEKIQDTGDLSDLDIDLDLDDEDIGFGALLLADLAVNSDDANVVISSLGWGEDPKSKEAIFLIEDLSINAKAKDGDPPVTISLGTLSGTGVDMEHIRSLRSEEGDLTSKRGDLNPFDPFYDGIFVEDFDLSVDTLSVNAPKLSMSVDKKGDVTTTQQSLEPLTISFNGEPEDSDMKKAWEMLKSANYETMVFSGQATTTLDKRKDSFAVTNGVLSLKDGFDVNYDYAGNGIDAMRARRSGGDASADALSDLTLRNLNVSLTDRSIVDRAIAFAAKQQGMPEMLVRMQAKGGVMFAGGMVAQQAETPEQQAVISDMVNAVSAFLDNGGTIHIKANPPTPLKASDFTNMDPSKLNPAELGLQISHEK